jgi:hypothetical protein
MKNCIFCGIKITKSNKSKEHVIPQWLLELLQASDMVLSGKHSTFPNNPEIIFSQRNHKIYSLLLGNVCKICNNGWMSELENNTKPLMTAILNDRSPTILAKEQCLTFAKWVFKTAAVLNYAENYKKIIPVNHIHDFYLTNELPLNVKVDMAFCRDTGVNFLIGGNKQIATFQKDQNKNELAKSYIVTLQFNHLLSRISWTPYVNFQVIPLPASFVYRIHPQENSEITIQVIKGSIFRDISQFHFVATVIAEDGVYSQIPGIKS